MGKAAYFDLFSGCSGDMILGALLDAGLPLKELQKALKKLPLTGYEIASEKVKRASVSATRFKVIVEGKSRQPHRAYKDIVELISSSALSNGVKSHAKAIFSNLAEAEAKIHGVKPAQVHFHEIGAVDSIVDIVGALIGFEILGVVHFYASPFPVGYGSVESRHGILPLPAPAALELITRKHAPVINPPHTGMAGKELVTPTGAAIVTSLASFERPDMALERIGYGAGSDNPENYPNIMRIWIGDVSLQETHGDMVLLETNIDDMNPQIYDYVMEKLFKQGALDVWLTPIQMKKNRPAIMLSVLAPGDIEPELSGTLMRETSTLGVRARPVTRHIAKREVVEVNSSLGGVRVKVKRFKGGILSIAPEYDDCRRIAAEKNIPLHSVIRTIEAEARVLLDI